MIRRQGYRFRVKPTQAESALLRRFVGCTRFVWNELLAQNEIRRERGERRLGYSAMCDYLVYLKDEYPFARVSFPTVAADAQGPRHGLSARIRSQALGTISAFQEARATARHPLSARVFHRRLRPLSAEDRVDRVSQESRDRGDAQKRHGIVRRRALVRFDSNRARSRGACSRLRLGGRNRPGRG